MAARVGEKAPGFTPPADGRESTVSPEDHARRGPEALSLYPADRDTGFPPVSDPGKEVIEEYGVGRVVGFPERAPFVIDRDGIARGRRVGPPAGDGPEVEAVLQDLDGVL